MAKGVDDSGKKGKGLFTGRYHFILSEHFMLPPGIGIFFLSLFVIVGTSTMFFINDAPYLAEKISIAFPIVGVILFVGVMANLIGTACMDPGFLSRSRCFEPVREVTEC